jgi:hypothetical protein
MNICNLNNLPDVVAQVYKKFPTEVWWRGHAKEGWNLLPHIWRSEVGNLSTPEERLHWERNITIRFLQGARTRHKNWPENDNSVELATMQHYGLPTRLLDWTESPLFALYFAVREHENENGALWALNPAALNISEFGTPELLSPYKTDEVKELFKAPFGVANSAPEKHAAVAMKHVDERMAVQLSTFTIHGSQVPLEKMKECDTYLFKYIVQAEEKDQIRQMLFEYGIREANLFPDLEHLEKQLIRMTQDGMIRGETAHKLYGIKSPTTRDK